MTLVNQKNDLILGIQPGNLGYGQGFTPDVLSAANHIIELINSN